MSMINVSHVSTFKVFYRVATSAVLSSFHIFAPDIVIEFWYNCVRAHETYRSPLECTRVLRDETV